MLQDEIKRIKTQLKQVRKTQADIEAWKREKEALSRELSCVRVASPQLGGACSRASGGASIVESNAMRHEKLLARMESIDAQIKAASDTIAKTRRALTYLDETARDVLQARYFDGKSVLCIALARGYSEGAIYSLINKAAANLAFILGGRSASNIHLPAI